MSPRKVSTDSDYYSSLRKHIPILQLLSKSKKVAGANFLKSAPEDVLSEICTCIHNALNVVDLPPDVIKKLQTKLTGDTQALKYLSTASKPTLKRRKVIVKSGGSIIAILGALLPVAISLIAEALKKKK